MNKQVMKKPDRTYRVIIGGGGTGGHVFPAISIANALRQMLDEVEFLFVGARGKLEMEKVPEAGYRIEGLPVAGFQRRITWKNITFFFKLLQSMRLSKRIIRNFRPDVAIGVGGYASGPILRAAIRKQVPVILQEQNSYAGVTNRILARSSEKICVAFDGMEKYFPKEKIVFTGNPVRQDLLLPAEETKASYAHFGLKEDKKVILLIGGSLGAGSMNSCMMRNLEKLRRSGIQLLWQSGKYYHEKAGEALDVSGAGNIVLLPFIREMNRAYQVADLIISRAGAGTISELCLVGKPVILVPSPNVAEDHQMRNARSLYDRNAAEVVPDKDAEKELVDMALQLIGDKKKMEILAGNISTLAIPDAAQKIAAEVIKIMEER
ncbi:MAG: undecaprenyldiphospho-muramoylpentapeptide beta-N-acetylglucosaminyltransferase [Bacteroidales bacterium]|nr:undecaprenyldiphospho-muramoylpentapeptide beta-N-acetylglucosaminyltransferase [Bacteroidales bacterium]